MSKKANKPPAPPAAKERKLYYGESVAWMDIPNNLLSYIAKGEDELADSKFDPPRRQRWPLLAAAARGKNDPEAQPIFVDKFYGVKHWEDWVDHAPSWMDPHLFLRMAVEDERVQRILRVSFAKNDPHAWSRLLPLFQEIMDTRYLPYVFERFEREAAATMAHWLIRNNAQQQLDLQTAQTAKRPRPQQ